MTNYAYRVDRRIAALEGYGTTVGEVSTSSLAAALTALKAATPAPFPLTQVYGTGQGAPGFLRRKESVVTAASSDAATSIYRMVRVPTAAKVKKVSIMSAIASAGSFDVDVAWPLGAVPSTLPPGETAGGIIQINGADNKLFGAAQSLVLSSARTDFTFVGTFTPAHTQMPLWQVLGSGDGYGGAGGGLTGPRTWTDDPGGEFEIILVCTTGVTTGGVVLLEVDYEV